MKLADLPCREVHPLDPPPRPPAPPPPRHAALSARELTVFIAIASGKRQCETANELQLSQKTVSTYRKRLLKKLGMKTNYDITVYCVRNGLLDVLKSCADEHIAAPESATLAS